MPTVVIAGATGFIGRHLTIYLREKGWTVRTLSRSDKMDFKWDPTQEAIDEGVFTDADVVINLAGRSIMAPRWSESLKRELVNSRVQSTHFLVDKLLSLTNKPRVIFSASAIGYYGTNAVSCTEGSAAGKGFLASLCVEWEKAAETASAAGIRLIKGRFGPVLDKSGGMLGALLTPFKFCLGGALGTGRQVISWISMPDLLRAISFTIEREDLAGPVNFVSPLPVTNQNFSTSLAKSLGRPSIFNVPASILRLVLGEMADEVLLSSAEVFPEKLTEAGFTFKHPSLEKAFRDLI